MKSCWKDRSGSGKKDLANGFFQRDSLILTFATVVLVELVELVELVNHERALKLLVPKVLFGNVF